MKVRSALSVSTLTLRAGGKSKKRNAVGAASACEPRGRTERPLGDKRGGALASSVSDFAVGHHLVVCDQDTALKQKPMQASVADETTVEYLIMHTVRPAKILCIMT